MSNQKDHRAPANQRNKRHDERPTFASGCSGEGHNGQIGRSKWKELSRRNERRNAKQGRPATIGKYIKKTFTVTPHEECSWIDSSKTVVRDKVRVVRTPKPIIPDTGEE